MASKVKLTEAQRQFVGTPVCRLQRMSISRGAVYFCLQCYLTTCKNECPFAAGRALLVSSGKMGE